MEYVIENSKLKVSISTKGAQMKSIRNQAGKEFLWQGSKNTWEESAPNLFPYVGRLTKETYMFHGKEYHMGIHGFAMLKEFTILEQKEDCITFTLEDEEETRIQYPFSFQFCVTYRLQENEIIITYEVHNKGKKTMYFGLGGHPGFNVPMKDNLNFEDYVIEFEDQTEPIQIGMSEDCFVTENNRKFLLEEGKYLHLKHDLFDNDAIILKDMGKKVTLRSEKGKEEITMLFSNMKYLGIWHWPKTIVDYICIEPWTSLPSRKGIVEELTTQKDLIKLEAKRKYINRFSIRICS
nr:aldose 1-epimerase family protein [uncultured Anaerocolumna sp.]